MFSDGGFTRNSSLSNIPDSGLCLHPRMCFRDKKKTLQRHIPMDLLNVVDISIFILIGLLQHAFGHYLEFSFLGTNTI